MKENQGQKETNKALDWLVSFTDMYFPSNAVAVIFFFYGVHENAFWQRIVTHSLLGKVMSRWLSLNILYQPNKLEAVDCVQEVF